MIHSVIILATAIEERVVDSVRPISVAKSKRWRKKCFIFLTLNNLIALLETKDPFLGNI